jgi:hypothetical protein
MKARLYDVIFIQTFSKLVKDHSPLIGLNGEKQTGRNAQHNKQGNNAKDNKWK